MNVPFKIALLLLLLPAVVLASEPKDQYKRTIDVSYPVNDGATLNVSNKYGKVILHVWNKKEIKATVTITGFGRNQEDSKSITDAVNVAIKHDDGSVSFQTSYGGTSGNGGWLSFGGKRDSKDYVNIDYEIYLPNNVSTTQIANNFGDVIADDLPGSLKLNINYCYYDIHSVAGTLDVSMNYCSKGKFGKAGNMRSRANYSTVQLESAGTVDDKSNYSTYVIQNVNEFLTGGNYNDYTLTKVGRLQSSNTYSDFKVATLTGDAEVKLTYSDLKIKAVTSSFKGLDAKGTYSNVKVNLPDNLDVRVEADLNHGDVHVGGLSMKNVTNVEKGGHVTYSGSTSTNCGSCPLIRLNGVYSDLSVSSK